MIAVVDYGAGNLGSVYKALRHVAPEVVVTCDPDVVDRATHLVLPGVGAFAHCMAGLGSIGMTEPVRRFIASGRPFLGICVGMQMLFDESEEMGSSPGLGVLAGKVVRFRIAAESKEGGHGDSVTLKVPHIGWNALSFRPDAYLFEGLEQGDRVYFVHSFYPEPTDRSCVSATTEYGAPFCCAVQSGNVHATQFHPEKSGTIGLAILRNFACLTA